MQAASVQQLIDSKYVVLRYLPCWPRLSSPFTTYKDADNRWASSHFPMCAHPRCAGNGLPRCVCAMHGPWLRLAKMALLQSRE